MVQFQACNQTSFRYEWFLCVYTHIYIKTRGSSTWIIKTQPLSINDFLFDPNQALSTIFHVFTCGGGKNLTYPLPAVTFESMILPAFQVGRGYVSSFPGVYQPTFFCAKCTVKNEHTIHSQETWIVIHGKLENP